VRSQTSNPGQSLGKSPPNEAMITWKYRRRMVGIENHSVLFLGRA